jgi:hypothetical protein
MLDGNDKYVALAEYNGTPVPLKTDPITGYLLCEVVGIGTTSSTPSTTTVDDNGRNVAKVQNPSGDIVILQSDNSGHIYAVTS